MNTAATTIFALAIAHTFLAAAIAERARRMRHGIAREIVHVLGEVEVVFGLWVVPLMIAMAMTTGWAEAVHYLNDTVNYTEPLFVVVIMALASTRPIVGLAESALRAVAGLGGATPGAWWMAILIVAPPAPATRRSADSANPMIGRVDASAMMTTTNSGSV